MQPAWAGRPQGYLLLFPTRALYVRLPSVKGTYLYLIMCWICRFMVRVNSTDQYSSRMGQKTGTSNTAKKVAIKPVKMERTLAYLQQGNTRGEIML